MHNFLIDMDNKFVTEQRVSSFDIALKSSPARWWDTHKGTPYSWDEVKISIQYRLLLPSQVHQLSKYQKIKGWFLDLETYDGLSNPVEHIQHCLRAWKDAQLPSYIWRHNFFHSLGIVPKYWYVHEETRRKTTCWKILQS
jgi:hypothetical protein